MPNLNYTISYNKELQILEFRHEALFSNGYNQPLAKLFNNFGYNLTNIILDRHNLSVCLISKYEVNAIAYGDDVRCNEHVTDIVFSHGEYRDYKNHYPGFLSPKQFTHWQNTVKEVDKPAILKLLYQDNKISRAYLLKYSNYPASRYELGRYNLMDNFFGKGAIQTKKIDELTLPLSIKEDLKCSLSNDETGKHCESNAKSKSPR
ncbi:hypothetical protein [Rickettsiella endosymbiont of Dermanyssus gallinae]|uniref:hypothetical protein n=1 Tax=Rickettsiella endosymbiont of Dermanyssus gallinae TaxID=2856608 RepID=UPI001C53326C|nr:hypothetical protein [Rickettsiella endosymbiont of Dermanyssus gallinae]